eukprot:1175832-Prorocentrum_minimum.AAC.1
MRLIWARGYYTPRLLGAPSLYLGGGVGGVLLLFLRRHAEDGVGAGDGTSGGKGVAPLAKCEHHLARALGAGGGSDEAGEGVGGRGAVVPGGLRGQNHRALRPIIIVRAPPNLR